MKVFQCSQIDQAIAHAAEGGQALHLHSIVFPGSPQCFRAAVARGEQIAHLFDRNRERLVKTVKGLGVRVVFVDKDATDRQHIDLCGGPLRRALSLTTEEQP